MTTQLHTVNENDIVTKADNLFVQFGFHHLPVVDDDNSLKGILSVTDVDKLKVGLSIFKDDDRREHNDALLRALMVEHVMTPDVIHIQENETIQTAYALFKRNAFHAIPVLKGEELVGIVTPMDILSHFLENV